MLSLDNTLFDNKYAANFNPAGFVLMEYLYKRANAPEHSENKVLLKKARASIEQYQADFQIAKKKASLMLENIELNFSGHSDYAQTLFEQCKFMELEQLNERLNASKDSEKAYSKLVELIVDMQAPESIEDELDPMQKLETLIFRQEQQARGDVGATLLIDGDSGNDFELKSLKTVRESMKYFNIDKTIKHAINDCPENAGPHNPHMLAITSLTKMSDLSPQYLRRFSAYIETVLWLEKSEARLKRKK